MICVIDNYDSFVYNLVQYAARAGYESTVFRHDTVTVAQLDALDPELIIISPGPGGPDDAGISVDLIRDLGRRVPILGVCLGHQCIGRAFGARIVKAPVPMHGKISEVQHTGTGVFAGLPNPLAVTRYHSLVVAPETLPAELEVTAWSAQGEIMGLRHRELPIEGMQFHPESLFTDHGPHLIANALTVTRTQRVATT